mgnify:CR=1 FL=1
MATVPAWGKDGQRKGTKDAGTVAGRDVKRIINEPTAAALAYGFNRKKDEKIVVFDFGGGTFDISVLEVGDDVVEVKATDGDAHLGGRDIAQHLIPSLPAEFTTSKLEEITKEFIDRSMAITKRAMEASPFKVGDIHEVILVGGQTRMPAIVEAVKKFFAF